MSAYECARAKDVAPAAFPETAVVTRILNIIMHHRGSAGRTMPETGIGMKIRLQGENQYVVNAAWRLALKAKSGVWYALRVMLMRIPEEEVTPETKSWRTRREGWRSG